MIEPLLTTVFLFAVLAAFLAYQAVALGRVFRSWAWTFIAGGFLVIGLRQLWMLLSLVAAAMISNRPPPIVTVEEWTIVGLRFLALGLICVGFHYLHRDLRRIGR